VFIGQIVAQLSDFILRQSGNLRSDDLIKDGHSKQLLVQEITREKFVQQTANRPNVAGTVDGITLAPIVTRVLFI
jgi:hypothetical protein